MFLKIVLPTWGVFLAMASPSFRQDDTPNVRWLRKNADRLRLDPDRIGVIGGSAGGHLASMVAVTGPADGLDPKEPFGEISARVLGVVDMSGPIDLMAHRDIGMFGKTRKPRPPTPNTSRSLQQRWTQEFFTPGGRWR